MRVRLAVAFAIVGSVAVALIPLHEYLHVALYWLRGGTGDVDVTYHDPRSNEARSPGGALGTAHTDEAGRHDHAIIYPIQIGLLAGVAVLAGHWVGSYRKP